VNQKKIPEYHSISAIMSRLINLGRSKLFPNSSSNSPNSPNSPSHSPSNFAHISAPVLLLSPQETSELTTTILRRPRSSSRSGESSTNGLSPFRPQAVKVV